MFSQNRNRGNYSLTQDGTCNCKDCGQSMTRKNLKTHYERQHPGMQPAERAPQGQLGLQDFMRSQIERRDREREEERLRQEEMKKQQEEEERKRQEEEEAKQREEAEQRQRDEAEQRQRVEEEQRKREVAEQRQREEEEQRKREEEVQSRQRQEEASVGENISLEEVQMEEEVEDDASVKENDLADLAVSHEEEMGQPHAQVDSDKQQENSERRDSVVHGGANENESNSIERGYPNGDMYGSLRDTNVRDNPHVIDKIAPHAGSMLHGMCQNSGQLTDNNANEISRMDVDHEEADDDVLKMRSEQSGLRKNDNSRNDNEGEKESSSISAFTGLPLQNDVNSNRKRRCTSPYSDRVPFHDEILERLKSLEDTVSNFKIADSLESLRRDVQNLSFQTMPPEIKRKQKESLRREKEGLAYDEVAMDAAKAANTVDEFVRRMPNVHYHYATTTEKENNIPDGVFCEDCATEVAQKSYGSFPGVIKYDFNKTNEQSSSKGPHPREFRNLKSNVEGHMKSKVHRKNVQEKLKLMEKEVEKEYKSKNERAGMNCGILAYKTIVNNHSYLSYESDVTTASVMGTYMGTKNHSRKFPTEMVHHFYESMNDKFRDQITQPLPGTGRAPPRSITMDKYTANGRTYNVTGINTYANGKVKTFFTDAYPVLDHTGQGIAKSVFESYNNVLDKDWRNRYVGSCSDGAMLHVGYAKYLDSYALNPPSLLTVAQVYNLQHLANDNNENDNHHEIENEDEQQQVLAAGYVLKEHTFSSHLWDGAHLVELADKDAKSQAGNEWVKQTTEMLTHMNKKVKYGKLREQAMEVAEVAERRFYAPKTFSNTRWSRYACNVIDTSLKDFSTVYDVLWRNEDALLDYINDPEFVLQSAVLGDIYSEKAKLSETLQVPDIYAWNAEKSLAESCHNLNNMESTLQRSDSGQGFEQCRSQNGNYQLLERFASAAKELSETNRYKGKPMVLDDDQNVQSVIDTTRCRAANYIAGEVQALQERFGNNSYPLQEPMSDLFDLERVLQREPTVIPDNSLGTYAAAAMGAKYLNPSTSSDNLRQQYTKFQEVAHDVIGDKYNNAQSSAERRRIEKNFYESVLGGHHGSEEFQDVNHLAASAHVRLSNESQVESMASQMKIITENRALDAKNIAKETFLTRNGPPPNENCKPLVEDGLRRRYKGGPEKWNFVDKCDRPDKLKLKVTSVVVDRVNQLDGKVEYRKKK